MSHVAAVILLYTSDNRQEEEVLRDVNAYAEFSVNGGLADLTRLMGGPKHPQLHVAGGAFGYLNIPAFLRHLRHVDWGGGYSWADVAIQDEHFNGVGWLHIYRGPKADAAGEAWSPDQDSRPSELDDADRA